MAYDPGSRSVVLYFAPQGGGAQTWRWDGARWEELHPRTTPDVVFGSLAFDGARLLLFGFPAGMVEGQYVTQTWAWDGTDWSLLSPAVRLPLETSYATAYDRARGRVVVYLDYLGGPETWVWDGATWSREHPQHEPTVRYRAVAWYDSRTRRVELYGGTGADFITPRGDIWAWDGADWTLEEGAGR